MRMLSFDFAIVANFRFPPFGEKKNPILMERVIKITRIYDTGKKTLIYVSQAHDIQKGSTKITMSTIPLFQP